MKLIITGATGNQGLPAVKYAKASGHDVTAMVRDVHSPRVDKLRTLGIKIVYGDMDKPETLDPAFKGMDGIFSIQNFWQAGHLREFFQGRAVVEAAKKAGIRHFVQTTAGIDPGNGTANMEVKAIIEALVRESFPDAFIIRPVWFIDGLNATSFNKNTRSLEFVTSPDQLHAWVACDDIGRLAVHAFDDFGTYSGITLNFASQRNTLAEMTEAFNKGFDMKLAYHQFTREEFEEKMHAWSRGRSDFYHELRAIFSFIRDINFNVDMKLHDKLMPKRHTLESWTKQIAYPLWKDDLSYFRVQ